MGGILGAALTQHARGAANFIRNATPAEKALLGLGLLTGCYLVKRALETWTGTFLFTAACVLGARHLLGRAQASRGSSSAVPSPTPLPSTLTAQPISTRAIAPIQLGFFEGTKLPAPSATAVSNHISGYTAQVWCPLPPVVDAFVTSDPSRGTRSWKPNPNVAKKNLAYIQLTHFNGTSDRPVVGEIMVHGSIASKTVNAFADICRAKFPIRQMRLIDYYGADDEASMHLDNSSGFCYRDITGRSGVISNHAKGLAIDINTFFNPYHNRTSGLVAPQGSDQFLDRNLTHPEMIKEGDACHTAFTKQGFKWGGNWLNEGRDRVDYQHFDIDMPTA